MLSLLTRQGRAIAKAIFWGNESARQFVMVKLGFVMLAALLSVVGLMWLAVLVWVVAEIGLAFWDKHATTRQGFSAARGWRNLWVRLGLASIFGLLAIAALVWLPLWASVPLTLIVLLVTFVGYVALNLRLLMQDMRGTPPNATSELFEQVRQMRDLPAVTSQLRLQLLAAKDSDERRNLTFYLAWAEIYQGHLLLPSNYQQSMAYYKAALELDPSNVAARASLTMCYLAQNEFELAHGTISRAVSVFNGQHHQVKYDETLWHWQRNEISSEYEQSAALFQLCALALAKLDQSNQSGAVKEILSREITAEMLKIPERSQDELNRLLAYKAGLPLSALQMLLAGPSRPPADPFPLYEPLITLPILPIQIIEPAA